MHTQVQGSCSRRALLSVQLEYLVRAHFLHGSESPDGTLPSFLNIHGQNAILFLAFNHHSPLAERLCISNMPVRSIVLSINVNSPSAWPINRKGGTRTSA